MGETVCLSNIKQTTLSFEQDNNAEDKITFGPYPFATVLRLRVLQIVCGITFLVMGAVGFIEERGELNLAFGVPAGSAIILAAAGSLHTTRGFAGYKSSTCVPKYSSFRFLGPTVRIAVPLAILWGAACSLVVALLIKSIKTLAAAETGFGGEEGSEAAFGGGGPDLLVVAASETLLCAVVMATVATLLRIDCKYDPD